MNTPCLLFAIGFVPRSPGRRFLRLAVSGLLALFLGEGVVQAETVVQATNSTQARDEAIGAVPFDQLTEEAGLQLSGILRNHSVYRRMPVERVTCDPEMYLFLVRHPEVIANVWQVMGVTNVNVERVDEFHLRCNDGNGTQSTMELVYGTPQLHIFYGEGTYDGPLWPRPIEGRSVMLLRTQYLRQPDGTMITSTQLDAFVQIDNAGAELIARGMVPIMGRTADLNFVRSTQFLSRIDQTARENGPGLVQLSDQLTNVDAAVRNRFAQLSMELWEAADQQAAVARPVSLMSPLVEIP